MGVTRSANLPGVVVALAVLAFWAYCLYDFARTDERDMRTFSRTTWLLLLVFASLFGALLWLAWGRPAPPRRDRPS